jgi:hypothetical protein
MRTSGGRLRGETVAVAELDDDQVAVFYELYAANYDAADRERFESDLREKDWVVVLEAASSGDIRGFSTQKVFRTSDPAGRPVRVVFSGDTIIDPQYWGEQELVRAWCRFAGQALAQAPDLPLYWLLISKGHRTYLYLPLFFERYFPRFDQNTPPYEARLLAAVARQRFGRYFDEDAGLLRFASSLGHLKPELAVIPPGRRDDPRVGFFLERNPGYAEGEELVCLARIGPSVMRGIAARSVKEGLALGPLSPLGLRAPAFGVQPAVCWTC